MNFALNMARRDLNKLVALSDARKRENASRRAAAQANVQLGEVLLEDARRRGQDQIDWPGYFSRAGM